MALSEQQTVSFDDSADIAPAGRICVLVLGMHRSGTSAVTRALSLMGAALPRNILGAQAGNEAGHWEPRRILVVHNELLETLGSSWMDWRPLDFRRLDRVARQRYMRRIGAVIAREYAQAGLFVVKDPRISRFADLFGEAIGRLGIETRAVLCLRSPEAVAASLHTRDGIDMSLGRLLWLRHTLDAEQASRGLSRSVVIYDDLLSDAAGEVSRLVAELHVPTVGADLDAVRAFIDPSLRHHEVSAAAGGFFSEAFETLTRLRTHGDTAETRAAIDLIRSRFDELTGTILVVEDAERDTVIARHSGELRQAIDALAAAENLAAEQLRANSNLLRDLDARATDLVSERAKHEQISEALSSLHAELEMRDAERVALLERMETHERRGRLVETLRHELEREHESRRQVERRLVEVEAAAGRTFIELGEAQNRSRDLAFERDQALASLAATRSSTSWRLTAPIRLAGHIARGNWHGIGVGLRNRLARLPGPLQPVLARLGGLVRRTETRLVDSRDNFAAIAGLVAERNRATAAGFPAVPAEFAPVDIDISIVTHNDGRWLEGFGKSLLALDYPAEKLHAIFVDNGSTDDTPARLTVLADTLRSAGMRVTVATQPNRGFGAGHNTAMRLGSADFVLVTNVDVEYAPDSLAVAVEMAQGDGAAAAWEMRQVPYEHPKFYDPVTGATNWNAHAAALLRRSAVMEVGGYDERLFMYGEDVDLSYRLRRAGHLLRYVPRARVIHHSYADVAAIKPRQFAGSTLANLYLRLKFGHWRDMLAIVPMALGLTVSRGLPPELRRVARGNVGRLLTLVPAALSGRRPGKAHFPFRRWDYEMIRDGGQLAQPLALPQEPPLVTVITRTMAGREQLLRQAVLSVRNQTYGPIEHIVVQDGGDSVGRFLDPAPAREGYALRFLGLRKLGRSAAGNAGLRAAKGHWCVFLDDDDLLFADHIETLVDAVLKAGTPVAYSLAWEVPTRFRPGEPDGYLELNHYVPPVLRQEFDGNVLRHHNFVPIQAVLFERRLFEERGGFEEDMEALEDWTLWNKYAEGNRFTYVPRTTSLYRVPGDAQTAAARADVLTDAYPAAVARIALNARRIAERS